MNKAKYFIIIGIIGLLSSCSFESTSVEISSDSTGVSYSKKRAWLQSITADTGIVHPADEDGNILTSDLASIAPFGGAGIYVDYYVETGKGNDDEFVSAFSDDMGYYSALFDSHNYYATTDGELLNNVRVLNESYGSGEAIELPEVLYASLKKSYDFSMKFGDKFNIGIGNLSSLWDEYISAASNYDYNQDYAADSARQQRTIFTDVPAKYVELALKSSPTTEQLKTMLEFNDTDMSVKFNSNAEIDTYISENKDVSDELASSSVNVSITQPNITLGGYGKGEATQLFADEFSDRIYLINSGSSSIKCVNGKPDGSAWDLSVANPFYYEAQDVGAVVEMNSADLIISQSGSFDLSTSGYYQNYFYAEIDGKYVLRHHIIDSTTGYSHSTFASASVLVSDSGYADMYTTALMNTDSIIEAEELRKQIDNFTGLNSSVYYLENKTVNNKKEVECFASSDLMDYMSISHEKYPDTFIYDSITTIEQIRG